ncbi:MAG: hypothetical protein IJD99_06340 [Clostridia bacterium]|nr:hypothetical protein [Clostridia bacterium]
MKKILSVLLALAMLVSLTAFAEAAPTVYVSISDDTGALVLAYAPVALSDQDGDGALTICDALMEAHAAHYPAGADGFLAEETEWGKSMYRLWGVENGGSYGYMVNDASPLSLLDPIQPGDHIKAYAFTDLTNYSDTYAYFSAAVTAAAVNADVSLTLSASGYDANWAPITLPVTEAVLTVNGEKTEIITDENGNAVLNFTAPGVYTVSAVSETMTLVPPVCIVTVTE